METVNVGEDIECSRIGLGTWAIGGDMWGGADEEESIRTIHAALERGINVIDTAPVYGKGQAERVVGKALADRRDQAVIATKAGLAWNEQGDVMRDARPDQITREVEASLRRLGTDVIDIYQVHWPDPIVPFEDTARAMEDLRQAGKVRAIGVSNFSPEQMDMFAGAAPIATSQPPFNLFEREAEDVLGYCERQNIVAVTYGALCRGLLSGRVEEDTEFPKSDLRRVDPKFWPARRRQYLAAVEDLAKLAHDRYNRTVLQLAVRWILDTPGVGIALWGARRPDQLDATSGIFGWNLDSAAREKIDAILATHIADPVGPDFMAPPARKSISAGHEQ